MRSLTLMNFSLQYKYNYYIKLFGLAYATLSQNALYIKGKCVPNDHQLTKKFQLIAILS